MAAERRCARCGAVLTPRGEGEASCPRCLLALGLSAAGALPDPDVAQEVSGVPVTEYCDRERLSVDRRLELFAEVCEAAHRAHATGALPGNLEPSTVLVTAVDGPARPRLVDPGRAATPNANRNEQALHTAAGTLAGPPVHLSPERLGPGPPQVDARSDVYTLGSMLYELLCGLPPFDARRLRQVGWGEMVRIVQQEEPLRPSIRVASLGEAARSEIVLRRRTEPRSLTKDLRGDLDAITLQALAKDPDHRYPSAEALAADIRRHLRGEPVAADPPGLTGRLGRTLRRHRFVFAAAAAALLATLLGFVVGAVL